MAAPSIAVSDLTMRFGEVTALSDLSLEAPHGITGLVGANGAGKTTLMRILLGLQRPTTGEVAVHGRSVAQDPMEVRRRVGWMPEGECLPPDVAAVEFVAHMARLAGLPPRAARLRASEVLFLVGLEEERVRPIGSFSTGMTQRVKLAQAIVHDPALVLLDEPASGLDPDGRTEMLALVRRLGAFGIDVLLSSHVLSDITSTADWVVLLDNGRLLRSGPMEPDRSTGLVEVEVTHDREAVAAHLRRHGVPVVVERTTLAVGPGGPELERHVLAAALGCDVGLLRMARRVTTLEDEFLEANLRSPRDGVAAPPGPPPAAPALPDGPPTPGALPAGGRR